MREKTPRLSPRKFMRYAFFEAVSLFRHPPKGTQAGKERFASSWQEGLLLANASYRQKEGLLSPWRIIPFYGLCFLAFLVLTTRLLRLQVLEGSKNLKRALSNRIEIYPIHAPRGVITDRHGQVLAQNTPGFRLKKKGQEKILFVDRDTAVGFETAGESVKIEVDSLRRYPYGELLAHVLGYIAEVDAHDLAQLERQDYELGDRIGRAGVEEVYEKYLRGQKGRELVEVDAGGQRLRVLRRESPKSGNDLVLALDLDLQKAAFEALRKAMADVNSPAGVVVAQDPKTGEILSLVSLPSFDNNKFTLGGKPEELTFLFEDPSAPLLNRAVLGTYPPGSIFKIVTAAAGLEEEKIDEKTQILDTGVLFLGPYSFANWLYRARGKTEGFLDLVAAIKRSNDIFFYRVGEWLGEKALASWARKFGLGKKTGIDLPFEAAGLVPDEAWKKQVLGEIWYPGDTLHLAIGQQDLLVTPLQISNLVSAVANGGRLLRPRLALKIVDGQKVVEEIEPQILKEKLLKEENLALIQEGMRQACSKGGTGWPFFDFPITVACKTGTAEFGPSTAKEASTHAWFTVYAPYENPKIVVTVLLEGGGEGANVAAPVAKEILEYWFNR